MLGPAVFLNLTFLTQIEGRSRQIHISVLDQGTHTAEEEGQDQCGDVATVHIGIGHDNHLVVTQLLHVQRFRVILRTDGYAHRAIDVLDFLAFEDLMIHRFLHVQYLTAQW